MKTKLLKQLRADAEKVYMNLTYCESRGWCIYGMENYFPKPSGKIVIKYEMLTDDREIAETKLSHSRRRYILDRLYILKGGKLKKK